MVDRVCGHTFLRRPLALVVDLGANRGAFRAAMQERGATVVSVEADPELADRIPGCRFGAIAGKSGAVALRRVRGTDATIALALESTETITVPAFTLADLFADEQLESVDLLKLDIEGAELDVLSGDPDPILRCEQIAVEFHDFLDHGSRDRVDATRRRLRDLGFHELRFSRDNTDVLYVKSAPAAPVRWWLILRHRYVAGAWRLARQRLRLG